MDLHTKRVIVLSVFIGVPIVVTIGIAAFDIWVYYAWGAEATISAAMEDLPPMIVFALGFVIGSLVFGLGCHFWWSTGTCGPK